MSITITRRCKREFTADGMENGYDDSQVEHAIVTTRVEPAIVRRDMVPYVTWRLAGERSGWSVVFTYLYDDTRDQFVDDDVVFGEGVHIHRSVGPPDTHGVDSFERSPKIHCSAAFKDPEDDGSCDEEVEGETPEARYWFHLTFSWDIPTYFEEIRGGSTRTLNTANVSKHVQLLETLPSLGSRNISLSMVSFSTASPLAYANASSFL